MSASRQMPTLTHLGYFGVTADWQNTEPRLCAARIPVLDRRQEAVINSGHPLSIDYNVEVMDWQHHHWSNKHGNTDLLEERLQELRKNCDCRTWNLLSSFDRKPFKVLSRSAPLSKLALPLLMQKRDKSSFLDNMNNGSYFSFDRGLLRFHSKPMTREEGIAAMAAEKADQERNAERAKSIKDGHLCAALMTNRGMEKSNLLVVGKDLDYTINYIDFGRIGVIVSKEVDCLFGKSLAEIKISYEKDTMSPGKLLSSLIKNVALGGTDKLVNLTISDNAIKRVGVADLNEAAVQTVCSRTYKILEEVFQIMEPKLSKLDEAYGHVKTEFCETDRTFVVHLEIFDGSSRKLLDKEFKRRLSSHELGIASDVRRYVPQYQYRKKTHQ